MDDNVGAFIAIRRTGEDGSRLGSSEISYNKNIVLHPFFKCNTK